MTAARVAYLSVFTIYVIFFCLFLRFYIWKKYSERRFWNTRPKLTIEGLIDLCKDLGKEVPFISILVPARNEADVIENTIRHLFTLNYPRDRYEVIVATDEKELLAAKKTRKHVLTYVTNVLCGEANAVELTDEEKEQAHALLLDGMVDLTCPDSRDMYRLCSSLDAKCRKKSFDATIGSLLKHTSSASSDYARARDILKAYYQIIFNVQNGSSDLQGHITSAVASMDRDSLSKWLWERLVRLYPTTQEVVEGIRAQNEPDRPVLKHAVVPYDFDGAVNGRLTGHEVKSTKGRALNWAVRYMSPEAQICGFYDAESRPDRDAPLFVAYRYVLDKPNSLIFQGPVFQVRNFYRMRPFCRIASLYQAVAHDWYLPWLFKVLPFVGGTNLYVDRKLLERIGGFDRTVLTEDLEFGVRAYLLEGAWPQYLPYQSTEQTPTTFKTFFRQRLRWATGHLQVVDKVSDERFAPEDRKRHLLFHLTIKGQVEWVIYQFATFVPPFAMILQYNHMLDETVMPRPGRIMMSLFSLIYLSFTYYCYYRYRRFFDISYKPEGRVRNFFVVAGLLLLPLAAFLFPLPYTSALILKLTGREPKVWVKTPRTRERTV